MQRDIDPDSITEIVAIDGPAGAGKSTVARGAARALGFGYLDSGAIYRAATWWALHESVDLDSTDAVIEATRRFSLDLLDGPQALTVRVAGQDVTAAIRTPEVTRVIYKLANNPAVRRELVPIQRSIAAARPTVAEGRDMGTVVFPHAKLKIYLDASIEERAKRRAADLTAQGVQMDAAALQSEIAARDQHDMTREAAPLRRAEDALIIDTTAMTVDEVVNVIVQTARTIW
jgi:cytidylate kinase